jgi:uncharacterized protein YggE
MLGIPFLITALGSTLLLQKGYAQTWEPRQIVDQRLAAINLSDQLQLDRPSNDTVMRLGVQSETEEEMAKPEENETMRTISVSGVGQVSARPDRALVRLGVQVEAGTAGEALAQNSAHIQNVLSALAEAAIPVEDIQTHTVQLQPRYDEHTIGQRLAGYMALNVVEVRVRNLDELGKLLDTAVGAGANTIQGIYFEVSDSTALLDQAREAAMQEAKHKAERLAALANAELGEVYTLNEASYLPPPVIYDSLAVSSKAVPIEPGVQLMRVEVQVTWALR